MSDNGTYWWFVFVMFLGMQLGVRWCFYSGWLLVRDNDEMTWRQYQYSCPTWWNEPRIARTVGWLAVCSMACCDVTGSVGGNVHAPERVRCSGQMMTLPTQCRGGVVVSDALGRWAAGGSVDHWVRQWGMASSCSRQDDIASSQQRYRRRATAATAAAATAAAADKSVKLLVSCRRLPATTIVYKDERFLIPHYTTAVDIVLNASEVSLPITYLQDLLWRPLKRTKWQATCISRERLWRKITTQSVVEVRAWNFHEIIHGVR